MPRRDRRGVALGVTSFDQRTIRQRLQKLSMVFIMMQDGRLTGAQGHGDAKGSQKHRHPELDCEDSINGYCKPAILQQKAHHHALVPQIGLLERKEGLVRPESVQQRTQHCSVDVL